MLTTAQWQLVDRLLELALDEDIGPGDATSRTLIPPEARLTARLVARQAGRLAGLAVVERLYARLSPEVQFAAALADGAAFCAGAQLAELRGPAQIILTGERLALNLLQRMCGVASLTAQFVAAVAGCRAKIHDTRKTMPGMRVLDKLAVRLGGGENHRQGLFDMILIKDNHLAWAGGSVAQVVARARQGSPLPIMVEVDTLEQLADALAAEPDFVLLDNLPPAVMARAVALTDRECAARGWRRPVLEASGGVNLQTVRAIAESGVDRISVGALTHSAPALDIGLDLD